MMLQPSPANGRGWSGATRQGRGQARRSPSKRRAEVLHEVHLVDLAGRDGLARLCTAPRVLGSLPGRLPPAHVEGPTGAGASSAGRTRQAASGSAAGSGRAGRAARRSRSERP